MADESAELENIFTKKVGPLPVIAWAGIAVVVWYVIKKKSSSSSSSTGSSAAATSGTGGSYGTDPAGNTGYIDPMSGYVYGSTEDIAALAQQNEANTSSGGTGDSGSSSTSTYTTNSAWEDAAINYLVGLGVDATDANSAIAAYLSSQSLSTTQQALVNEAIQTLGAPPQPPTATTSPPPVVNPPGGATTYATNPPTGLTASGVTATSASLKWNAASNATAYSVSYKTSSGSSQTVTTSTTSVTLPNLTPSTNYSVSVMGTPADTGAGAATTTFTTSYGAVGSGQQPVTPGSSLQPGQQIAIQVALQGGKTVTTVAKQFDETVATILAQNPGANAGTSSGIIEVPYLVKKGDTIASIASKFGISTEHLTQELQAEGIS
jgi:Fibronectin type III domain/LysM domain